MFFKRIENNKIKSICEVDFFISNEEYEQISREEYEELKQSLNSMTKKMESVEGETSPTYEELSEACDILMGGVE